MLLFCLCEGRFVHGFVFAMAFIGRGILENSVLGEGGTRLLVGASEEAGHFDQIPSFLRIAFLFFLLTRHPPVMRECWILVF